MRTIVYEKYGNADVLKLKEVEPPKINDEELLIRISSTAVNSADVKLRKAKPYVVRLFNGLFKPKNQILGSSFSGKVVLKGKNVNKFNIGDEIFAYENFGAYSEYKKINQNSLILKKPNNIPLEEISAIPFGALSALYFLEDLDVNKHKNILLIGAAGNVGINALQILKSKGFDVDVVANSKNKSVLNELGANNFYDYKKVDIFSIDKKYDAIFDCSAVYSFLKLKELIKDNASFITTKFSTSLLIQKMIFKNKYHIKFGIAKEKLSYLKEIAELIESNKLKAIINKKFELKDVNKAHKYYEENSKSGSILISIN